MPSFVSKIWRFIKARWLLLLIILIVMIVIGLIVRHNRQAQNKPLTYVQPEYRDLTKTLQVSGVVDAEQTADMHYLSGGKLTYLGVKEGEAVKKGQTIATIDQSALQKQLQTDLNNYTKERLSFDDTQNGLKNSTPTDQQQLTTQTNQLDLNNTVLAVEIRSVAIRDTRLVAPFAGILVTSPATVTGINIAGTDVFSVVNPQTLIFKAAVDESDIALVKPGQQVQVTLDAYPDDNVTTTLSSVGFKSQQTSTSTVYIIKMPLTGDDQLQHYKLGMNGDATINLESKQHVLAIPIDATRQRDDKTYVDVKDGANGKLEREIQTGLETDDYVEVTGGLTTSDQVVMPQAVTTK